jgi:O-acetyl-ADP-ribose deacetylase (regulator of RNase III)
MKDLLRDLVTWMETCHLQRAPCRSPFEAQVEPVLLMQAEMVLNWARTTDRPVELFTASVSDRSLLAGLVFRRSQVAVERVFQGELEDDDFERLARCVCDIRHSQLTLMPGWPSAAKLPMAFFGGPLYAVLTMWKQEGEARTEQPPKAIVRIVDGNLLDQDVEVIVNAWNRNVIPWWLLLPQGVSGAIKRRAGYQPFRELARKGPIPLGGAVETSAGALPFKAIIHVAGIDLLWRSSERAIRGCVRSGLKIAHDHGYRSIAFPLIGAGTGGYSPEKVVAIMAEEMARTVFILEKSGS